NGLGCCNEGQVYERRGGEETLRATWRSGQQLVLSYLPLLGFAGFTEPTELWASGGAAPAQLVWIGGPRFQSHDRAAAIYGIGWNDPITPARVSTAERLSRAEAIAARTNWGDRLPAIDMAMSLADEGQVTDGLIRLMVSFIEYDTARERMAKFWF